MGIGAPSFIATVNNDAETRTSVSLWRALMVYYGLETNLRSENRLELSPDDFIAAMCDKRCKWKVWQT